MMNAKRLFSLILVAGLLAPTNTHARPSGSDPIACTAAQLRALARGGSSVEVVTLKTFHVVIEAKKKTYRVGETALIEATVTRPAHEDPAGQGIPIDPPISRPVENAVVGIGVSVGDVFLYGYNVTGADGKSVVRVKLRSYTEPGAAETDAYAGKTAANTTCLRVDEYGYTSDDKLFEVVD